MKCIKHKWKELADTTDPVYGTDTYIYWCKECGIVKEVYDSWRGDTKTKYYRPTQAAEETK